MAAEIVSSRHSFSALGLQFPHNEHRAIAACDLQALLCHRKECPRRFVRRPPRLLDTEDLERLPTDFHRRYRPRDQPAHLIDDVPRALRPVDGTHALGKHRRIRRLRIVLRRALRRPGLDGPHGVAGEIARDDSQTRHQLAARLHRVNRRFANFNDVALIHPGGQIHRAHAGLVAVVQN